ncbi:hypothetical protein ACJ6WF_18440 [Streptomyces sp. MMS24-I2-30]|uniref:hypothetical protein n=1 Tax=Streptomyces sp. MMS24-I2-30 TaxID=3351564 RepID=UPI0038969316
MRYSDEEKTAYLEQFKEFYESGKGSRRKFAIENGLGAWTFNSWVAESEKYGVDLDVRAIGYSDEEKTAYLEQFKEFHESGKGSRRKFAIENGLGAWTFNSWVAESEKYGVDLDVRAIGYSDEEKTAYLEQFKEFHESGKGGRGEFAKENGIDLTTFCEWVAEPEKYGVDLEARNRRLKRYPPEQVKSILKAWMADPERRTITDFAPTWPDPILERTMQNWAKNASKYGLSQEAVDACRESRLKKRGPAKSYTDDEKQRYVDGLFGQRESLEEYARAERIPPKTLKNWLKNPEIYGWEQWRTDLVLKAGGRVGLTAEERAMLDQPRGPRQDQEVAGTGVSAPVEELPQEAAGSPDEAVPSQQAWEARTQLSLAEYATGGLGALGDSSGPLGSPALVSAATGGTALPGITSFDWDDSWGDSAPPSPSPLPSVPSDYLRGPGASASVSDRDGNVMGPLPALPKDVVPRQDYFYGPAGSKGPARGGR